MNHALLPQPNEIREAQLPVVYSNAKLAIAECNRIDECKDWGDKMQAMASYAKQSQDKEMENMAMRIRARAVRRCGILLQEIEKGSGKNHGEKGGEPPISLTRKDAAAEAGLSPDQAKQSIRVANVPEEDFDCQIESENPSTITSLAEQGTRKLSPMEEGMKNGVPAYEQLGMTKKAFQAGMYFGGGLKTFAEETGRFDPQDVVDGSTPKQRDQLRQHIKTVDDYLDRIIAKL